MIGPETIDRIRDQTNIVDLIGETVRLTKQGLSHVGRCPFHREKTPSFHVNPERGFFHCFGCGESGDAIKFLQQSEGLSFTEVVRRLAERAGIALEETPEERQAHRRRQALYEANAAAAVFFERMLREHPLSCQAAAELDRRGLAAESPTDPIADALQAFRIGYAPYGWESLVRHLRDAGLSLQAAEETGLVVPRRSSPGHYDRFRHRLMFAVLDLLGRVIAFSGRALPEPTADQLRQARIDPMGSPGQGEASAKYINSPESPIYQKREAVFGLHQARQSLRQSEECLLVEGNFDVVSLHARGIKNAVAPLGTAFTVEQARLIKRFTPKVTFMFDPDPAGRRAVAAAREACQEAGLMAKVASLPEGEDPDELARSKGPEAVRQVAKAARDMLEYLIDSALDSGVSADDAVARAAKVHEVAQLLAGERDPTIRAMARESADRVAERLGITDHATLRELRATLQRAISEGYQARQPTQERVPAAPAQARSPDLSRQIGHEILGAFLDYPQLLGTDAWVEVMQVVGREVAAAIDAVRQCWDGEKGLDLEQLLAKLPPSIHPFAAARLAAPRHEQSDDARNKLLENVNKLKRLQLKCSSLEVEELQRAAASGDFDQEVALLREHERRARKRRGL